MVSGAAVVDGATVVSGAAVVDGAAVVSGAAVVEGAVVTGALVVGVLPEHWHKPSTLQGHHDCMVLPPQGWQCSSFALWLLPGIATQLSQEESQAPLGCGAGASVVGTAVVGASVVVQSFVVYF